MQTICQAIQAIFFIVLGTIVALVGMITGGDTPPAVQEMNDDD